MAQQLPEAGLAPQPMAQPVAPSLDVPGEMPGEVPGEMPGAPPARRRWWERRSFYAALVVLYVLGWAISGHFPLSPTDLDVFFLPSAKIMLGGHPWQAYAVRYAISYPNANGPLSLLPLTLAAWVAQRGGWLDDPTNARTVILAIFAVFPLLMSYEAVRAVDRVRGVPLQGRYRLFAYAIFALTPQLWHSMLFYGHIEQPIEIWLVLLGLRLLSERRAGWAGLCLGLALLARSSAVVLCIPLVLLPLCRRRWREGAWQLGALTLSVVGGLLPFWLADRADVLYSLLTFRGELGVGGGSVWGVVVGTPWEAFAKAHDSVVVMAAAALLSLIVLLARPTLETTSRELLVLLAICAFCFPLFIKTMWPYYFLEPYVIVGVWWLAQPAITTRRARLLWFAGGALTAGMIGIAQLGELGADRTGTLEWMRGWSLGVSLAIVVAALLLVALGMVPWRRGRAAAPPPPSEAVLTSYNT